jgi:putative transposase
VPRGLYRIHQSRLPHFITFTCYRRHHYVSNHASRDEFLKSLERTRLRYNLLIYGFVVMPNHIHVLISEPQEGTIANVIQSLKISSAKQIKAKQGQKPHNCQPKAIVGHERNSPFWQARYYDRNVRDHDEFTNDLKYIHRNPVKRGGWPTRRFHISS